MRLELCNYNGCNVALGSEPGFGLFLHLKRIELVELRFLCYTCSTPKLDFP